MTKKISKQEEIMMMTEWNVKRIAGAVAVVLFIIWLPFYMFNADTYESELEGTLNQQQDNKQVVVGAVGKVPVAVVENGQKDREIELIDNKGNISSPEPSLKSSEYTDDNEEVNNKVSLEEDDNPQLLNKNEDGVVVETSDNSPSISSIVESNEKVEAVNNDNNLNEVKDDKISRALLTTGLNNREPIDNITSPIYVSKQAAIKIYYFTEIMNMEGEVLYHNWLREGESVFKKEIKISGQRWRASTNKFIQYFDQGEWTVILVNKEGDVLNEVQFKVVEK